MEVVVVVVVVVVAVRRESDKNLPRRFNLRQNLMFYYDEELFRLLKTNTNK